MQTDLLQCVSRTSCQTDHSSATVLSSCNSQESRRVPDGSKPLSYPRTEPRPFPEEREILAADCSCSILAKSQPASRSCTLAISASCVKGFSMEAVSASDAIGRVPDIRSVAVDSERFLIERTSCSPIMRGITTSAITSWIACWASSNVLNATSPSCAVKTLQPERCRIIEVT